MELSSTSTPHRPNKFIMPLLICTFALIISCAKGAESLNAPPPWRTAEGRSAVSLSLLIKRHGTALAVTFGFRWLWPYSTLLPEPWAATDGPCWRTSRESHPSEDLSELPPLLVAVAGQEYHDRLTGASRFELPDSNAKNGFTLAALFSRLFIELCSTGGSWRIFGFAVPSSGPIN